jgi:hypothetical protein
VQLNVYLEQLESEADNDFYLHSFMMSLSLLYTTTVSLLFNLPY